MELRLFLRLANILRCITGLYQEALLTLKHLDSTSRKFILEVPALSRLNDYRVKCPPPIRKDVEQLQINVVTWFYINVFMFISVAYVRTFAPT